MDAILFSAAKRWVDVDDAIRHLEKHDKLYWEVGFRIKRERFLFPMDGFIHIGGGQIEYKVTIIDIFPFSADHYENPELAPLVKPEIWLKEWNERKDDYPSWKYALVMTKIERFSYDTLKLRQHNGSPVTHPPQTYIKIIPPSTIDPDK